MLSVRARIVLLVLLPAVVLVLIGGDLVVTARGDARNADRARNLASLGVELSGFIHQSQRERGLTAGFYGDPSAANRAALDGQRARTDERINSLHKAIVEFDAEHFGTGFQGRYNAAVERLRSVSKIRSGVDQQRLGVKEALGSYTQMHAELIELVQALPRYSSSKELIDASLAYVALLNLKERTGIERAVLNNTFARGSFAPGMRDRHAGLVALQSTFQNDYQRFASPELSAMLDEAIASPSYAEVLRFRAAAHDDASHLDDVNMGEGVTGFDVDPGAWFASVTEYIDLLKVVEDQASAEVLQIAGHDLSIASTHAWIAMGVVTGGVVLMLGFGCSTMLSIIRPLGSLRHRLEDIASGEGDLTQRLDASRRDEFGRVAAAFNLFISSINDVVKRVSDSSAILADNASSIARTSAEMLEGVGNQTGQTMQVSAAIEQMSASVSEVAQNGQECASAARHSREAAESGGTVVAETVEEMRAIATEVAKSARAVSSLGERSEEIGQIISVINDIADQTNLLALNAAIEAARAGEHGRGFSVVADEVRKLAERTTHATGQVRDAIGMIQAETESAVTLIESGTTRVSRGVGLAEQAGEAMGQSVHGARSLMDMIESIAAAAGQQSAVSTEIAAHVESIQSIGESSNAKAGENAAVAQSLAAQAEELRELVNGFKVA